MKIDEQFDGIEFSDAFADFPDLFDEDSKRSMEGALQKWNEVHQKYVSVKELFAKEEFSDDEIYGYALYRTILHYNQFPPQVSSHKLKYLETILETFTIYYRELAVKK
jgi:hypothetical protein